MNIPIIYEDENILAVNKPAGLLVHQTQGAKSKQQTIIEQILQNYPKAELAHRLDKDTSGVLLIAKNHEIYEFLKKQFQDRSVKKTYLALVEGKVKNEKGKIETPIKRFTKSREAETEYKVIKRYANYTLLQVSPKTGRTHQIRLHLKSIGHPVVCEKLYVKKKFTPQGGAKCPFGLKRHFLHASSTEFYLPDKGKIKLETGPPNDLRNALNLLQEYDKK